MQIIFGKAPTLIAPRSRYAELWQALRKSKPGEWLAISVTEVTGGKTPSRKRVALQSAAKSVGIRAQVVQEGDLIFVRVRPSDAPQPPTQAPAQITATPPKPKPVPAPEPKPTPTGTFATPLTEPLDLSAFLRDCETVAGTWNDIDLGDDHKTYKQQEQRLKRLADLRGVSIETRVEDGFLYCRVTKSK